MFGIRFWGLAALCTVGIAALIGAPTALIPTAFFIRMTPTGAGDYIVWATSAALVGPLLALSLLYPVGAARESLRRIGLGNVRAMTGVALAAFSVGCPVCNKLVVLFLGIGGAMTLFNPLRPWLGAMAVLLLGTTLLLRVRTLRTSGALSVDQRTFAVKS